MKNLLTHLLSGRNRQNLTANLLISYHCYNLSNTKGDKASQSLMGVPLWVPHILHTAKEMG